LYIQTVRIHLKGTQKEWQIVFIIVVVIYVIGGVAWCLLCDGNTQPWAKHTDGETTDEELEAIKGRGLEEVNKDKEANEQVLRL
jgi:hypothetical protein